MTRQTIILIIILTGTSLFSFGQMTAYQWYDISEDSIRTIKEWKISYDTTGQVTDTVLEYEFIYSDKGDLLEKRHNFNNDNSKYISTTYKYDRRHNIKDSEYDNPYTLMDGVYLAPPDSKCETLRYDGQPINSTLSYENGDMEFWTFTYNNNLLTSKAVYRNGRLKTLYKIEYTRE